MTEMEKASFDLLKKMLAFREEECRELKEEREDTTKRLFACWIQREKLQEERDQLWIEVTNLREERIKDKGTIQNLTEAIAGLTRDLQEAKKSKQ